MMNPVLTWDEADRQIALADGEELYTSYNGQGPKEIAPSESFDMSLCVNQKGLRDTIYVCGPQNSGKSHVISQYLEDYTRLYPNKKIVLFSMLDDDPVLDKYKMVKRVDLTDFEYSPDLLKALRNRLIIFDDVDCIADKKISKEIYQLINEILSNGRKLHISIIVTNHLVTDYHRTRTILNECDTYVVFPKCGSSHHDSAHCRWLLRNRMTGWSSQTERRRVW